MAPPVKLVLAEKPSVARDIARVLGATSRGEGSLSGSGWIVSWCIGHLIELDEPESYDPKWKRWSFDTLPMIPPSFRLRPAKNTRSQWRIVRELLRRRDLELVVNACDAGREGELIFRYCYQHAASRLAVKRLWISSLTEQAIRAGFAKLEPGARYDPLGDAARARSEADWLVGLNATRAMTLVRRGTGAKSVYSIGRVQTPTLAMLVHREQAILRFVPQDFFEVFADAAGPRDGVRFSARWRAPSGATRFATPELAERLAARARAALPLEVEHVGEKKVTEIPPQLYDLTSLQRAANRRFGYSAEKTLKLAQALYEEHKLISYPRTDARVLSEDQRPVIPDLVRDLASVDAYRETADALMAAPLRIGRRLIDDAKVGDHHAIIPTGKTRGLDRLSKDEARIFDLIARRLLAALSPDAIFAVTEIVLRAGPPAPVPKPPRGEDAREVRLEEVPPPPDRFHARGRVRLEAGWQAIDGELGGPPRGKDDDSPALPKLIVGEKLDAKLRVAAGKTQPPKRHNDATLLTAMETAGREVEDEALREAMRDSGLGTPATRASIIETLIARGYVERREKLLVPTAKGMALIETLPVPVLASPELTGQWEARLARISRREDQREAFMRAVGAMVEEIVRAIRAAPPPAPIAEPEGRGRWGRRRRYGKRRDERPARVERPSRVESPARVERPAKVASPSGLVCPRCKTGAIITGKRAWGCGRWKEGCHLIVPFEMEGRRVTESQLRDLITKGRTRASKDGRLVLTDQVRFVRRDAPEESR